MGVAPWFLGLGLPSRTGCLADLRRRRQGLSAGAVDFGTEQLVDAPAFLSSATFSKEDHACFKRFRVIAVAPQRA